MEAENTEVMEQDTLAPEKPLTLQEQCDAGNAAACAQLRPVVSEEPEVVALTDEEMDALGSVSEEPEVIDVVAEEEEVVALTDEEMDALGSVSEEPSVSRKMAYGASDEPMIGGSILRAVETGFEALTEGKSWSQSREDVEAERKADLYHEYPEFMSGKYDGDAAVMGGRVATAVVDPATFFLPWAKAAKVGNLMRVSVVGDKTTKTAKAAGAVVSKVPLFALGATTSAADYSMYAYMRDGNVDTDSLFLVTAAGGTLTVAVEPFAKYLISKYQKTYGTGVSAKKLEKVKSVEEVEKMLGQKAYNALDIKQKKAMNEVFDFDHMQDIQHMLNRTTNMVKERGIIIAKKTKLRKQMQKGKMSKSGGRAQIKAFDKQLENLSGNIIDKRTKVIKDFAEDIRNNRHLTAKALSFVVRPLVGAGLGGTIGLLAGADDDKLQSMMMWGAALGLAQKGIQSNTLLNSKQVREFSRVLHAEQALLAAQYVKASTALTHVTRLKAGSDIARTFADKMHHSFSTKGVKQLSVEERATSAKQFWDIVLIKDVLKNTSQEEQRSAVRNLRGFATKAEITPTVKQLSKDLKSYLDNFSAYNKDVGISPKEVLDNYFPREYRFDMIDTSAKGTLPKGHIAASIFDGKDFIETLTQIYKRRDKLTLAAARKRALAFEANLRAPGAGVTNDANFKLSKVPYVTHLEQKRQLHGTIKVKGKTIQIEELLEPWLKVDVKEVLSNMTKESTKAVEFTRTFGQNGRLVSKALSDVRKHYDNLIEELDTPGLSGKNTLKGKQYEFLKKREIKRIKGGVDAYFGVYGMKADRFWNNMAAGVSLYNSTKMLEDVSAANLGDLIQPFIQGAELKDVLRAWRNTSFRAKGTDAREALEPAHVLNILGGDMLAAEARATAGILEDTGGLVRKWSDSYYKVTGLNAITSYARRFAFNVGAQDLFTLAKRNSKNRARVIRDTELKYDVKWGDLTEAKQRQYFAAHKKAYNNQRMIEEGQYYGVSTKEMLAISKFDTLEEAYADKNLHSLFHTAGFRAMERDAKIPTVGNRLLFTQSRNPTMRLLGQFTSWAQSHSAMTNAMIKKIEDGNTKQAVRMISSIAVFHQVKQLRDIIRNGETDDDLTFAEHAARAVDLSGTPGVWAGYYGSTLRAAEGNYDYNPLTGFPAGRSAIDIYKQFGKEDNFLDLVERIREQEMSTGDAWQLIQDHYEGTLPLPKSRGIFNRALEEEAVHFNKGGLVTSVTQKEMSLLGFAKGGF